MLMDRRATRQLRQIIIVAVVAALFLTILIPYLLMTHYRHAPTRKTVHPNLYVPQLYRSPPPPSLAFALAARPPAPPPKFLIIVLSARRPNGMEYVSNLTRLLQYEMRNWRDAPTRDEPDPPRRSRIVIYDADSSTVTDPASTAADTPPAREWLYSLGVDVLRTPPNLFAPQMAELNTDPALDKHNNSAARIRWRAKNGLDYGVVLEYAYSQRDDWPYAIVLEDDVWLAHDFADRLSALVAYPYNAQWWAFTLFHSPPFDTLKEYRNGGAYEFKACSQAVMYATRSRHLPGFISYVKANYAEDPFDFLLRNFQFDHKKEWNPPQMYVTIPSLAQHIGVVSSLASKSALVLTHDTPPAANSTAKPENLVCAAVDFADAVSHDTVMEWMRNRSAVNESADAAPASAPQSPAIAPNTNVTVIDFYPSLPADLTVRNRSW